jgi:glutaconate CoA-transferase subunit A
VDHDLSLQDSSNNTFLPAIDVDVVVKVPFGAHPSRCGTLYPVDEAHMKEYLAAAKEERSFREYLEKYVFTLDGHGEYLKRAGLAAIAA